MSKIEIWTDGACSGNPGPGGWGVVIDGYGDERIELYGSDADTTNNRMEMLAAIEALKAIELGPTILLHTDSKYVMDGINDWIHGWKRRGWKTASKKPVKNKDLWIELDEINSKHDVTWNWVKGHDGNEGNERGDALARLGAEEAVA